MKSPWKIRIITILSHPALLAVPALVLVLILGDLQIKEFEIRTIILETRDYSNEKNVFVDINEDGNRELIRAYNLVTNACVNATAGNTFIETWNLPGYWYEFPDFILEDHDGDGIREMYALTINGGDSILAHQLVLKQDHQVLNSRFVCQVGRFNEQRDFGMKVLGFCEMNGDDNKELIFYINGGFTEQPRAIYAWDLSADTLFRSPLHGINSKITERLICSYDSISHQTLLFISSTATDNNHGTIPYADTASYALIYTRGLEYLFEPKYLGGAQSNTSTYPFCYEGREHVLAVAIHPRNDSNKIELVLMDTGGDIISRKNNTFFDLVNYKLIIWVNSRLVFIGYDKTDDITQAGIVNTDLGLSEVLEFPGNYSIAKPIDLDQDPEEELILADPINRIILILEEDLSIQAKTSLPFTDFEQLYFQIKNRNNQDLTIYAQSGQNAGEINLTRNARYPFRWLLYLLYYGISAMIFFLLRMGFTYTIRQRASREKRLIEYQMQTVLNQLNPHFTFNAINSIGDAVLDGRNEEAYEYFTKLSGLIRKSMTHAIVPYKSLGDEIEFVREYLEIESYRFGERLKWDIVVDPLVDLKTPVPKMLMHIFVENALKHGIFHLKGIGSLKIAVKREKSRTLITIADNGVGFAKAYEIEGQKGQGIEILNQYLEIYNSSYPQSISYDLQTNPGDPPSGTRVLIHIRD